MRNMKHFFFAFLNCICFCFVSSCTNYTEQILENRDSVKAHTRSRHIGNFYN